MVSWRVCLASFVVGCSLLLAGCDAYYQVVLQNESSREVVVSLLENEVPMRPCSVGSLTSPGPGYGSPVKIDVTDRTGEVVYTTTIKAGPRGRGNPFHVRIPPEEAGECLEPITDRYFLIVENHYDEDVDVWHHGESLGWVTSHKRERFGPLPGTWRDLGEVTIRTPGGKEDTADAWGLPGMDYDLGQVPEAVVVVSGFWP